jgi:DNA-binding response OmpR family regulator
VARMLVVDDEREIVRMLAEFLRSRGHRVAGAHSGAEAVAYFRRRPFDVVLLDILMPGMDGNETLRRLKALDPGAVVIMISGTADEKTAEESLLLGAYDYIRKPFDFGNLEAVLATGLAMRA